MNNPRTRLLAISGATLALVVASTAVVSAHPGDRGERGDQRGNGRDRSGQQFQRGPRDGKAMHALRGPRDGKAMHGQLRGAMNDRLDSFVRRETTLETDAGVVTRRVDNGTTTASADSSLDYTLATGDTASVITDEETKVMSISQQTAEAGRRGHESSRLVPVEIALADIETGSEVVVWAESQEDGTFLAQRIVVRPDITVAIDAAAGSADDSVSGANDDSTSAPATDA